MAYIILKKIDKLLLRSFVTTFIWLLTLVLFVLIMQSFFLLLESIVGKGLGICIYAKLLFYIGLSIFPNAFPIAMMMTALIVFGNFSEHFELIAMRSIGLPLQRILRFPFVFVLFLSSALFYFQSYVYPTTKHKIFALVEDVWKKKSALFIQEGIFCNNIPGYSIWVEKKLDDQGNMVGIMLYDYTKTYGKIAITTAKRGRLYTTPDEGYLTMELHNGHNYVEELPTQNHTTETNQRGFFYRSNFTSQKINISLDALKLDNTHATFAYDPRTRIRPQLKEMIQEKQQKIADELQYGQKLLAQQAMRYHHLAKAVDPAKECVKADDDFLSFRKQMVTASSHAAEGNIPQHPYSYVRILQNGLRELKKVQVTLTQRKADIHMMYEDLNYALFEKESRLAITVRCVIMFLLAAPLGCIIRRGAFGMSVLISSFFILLEYMLSMFGKDWAVAGSISVFMGAWLANLSLLPFCFFFLTRAQQGRGLFVVNWGGFYAKVKGLIPKPSNG